jgi:hypothetical protein
MSTKALERVSVIPESEPTALVPVTPMDMLNRAVSSGADIDMIEKLMNLHERWETSQARKAFDEAVAAAKKEIPPITRNATGHNSKKYADFAAIAKVIDPIIGKHGLSYRFRTTQNGTIAVTCILSHKAGHSEETTLCGPADKTGSKNDIQAIGSTLTYLQRYSLVQMLGLAASNDDDGKAGGNVKTITQEQADALRDLIETVGANREAFLNWAKKRFPALERFEDIPAADFEYCRTSIQNYKKA